jgi:RHS repeat-associated protein
VTGDATHWENDTAHVDSLEEPGGYTAPGGAPGQPVTLNTYYGRVLYVSGRDPEHPLEVVRLNYTLQMDACPPTFVDTAVFIPSYNYNGVADNGSLTNGQYMLGPFSNPCGPQQAVPPWFGAYAQWAKVNPVTRYGWFGSVAQFHQDATGLTNLRNRQYDSRTGRFTQEDPIGLAGGMNAYGFAAGDPVNYSDPFGLESIPPWLRRTLTVLGGAIGISTSTIKGSIVERKLEARAGGKFGQQIEHTIETGTDAEAVHSSGQTEAEANQLGAELNTETVDVVTGTARSEGGALAEGVSELGGSTNVVGAIVAQVAGAVLSPTTMGNGQPTPDGRLKYWKPVAIPWNLTWPH